ncbi:MAG: agmatinase [Bacillota bacterium]
MGSGAQVAWAPMGRLLWSSDSASAPIVVLGVPLDETTSFRPGARFGPTAIREASHALEDYSLRQSRCLEPTCVYDAGDLVLPLGNVQDALDAIKTASRHILENGQKFLALGGEHLLSWALVDSVLRKYPDLVVIQFDAHADLREEYTGTAWSHATVMRRVIDLLGPSRLYQIGIRSADKGELDTSQGMSEIHFYHVLEPVRSVMPRVQDKPVYLSIDIDVVDPAFAPGTGVPEPGGITSRELLDALSCMKGANIVGVDLVEVAPAYDSTGQTGLLAAAIVRECLLLLANDLDDEGTSRA